MIPSIGWKLVRILFLIFFLAGLGLGLCTAGLKSYLTRLDFKLLAETKVSELFRAKVRVGKIQLRFLNQIALSRLEIEAGKNAGEPYELKIEKILFRYRWFDFLSKKFKTPVAVVLEAPSLSMRRLEFPYRFFENLNFGPGGRKNPFSTLEVAGGEIRFALPHKEILVKKIRGSFVPLPSGLIQAQLRGEMGDFVSGHVRLAGEINPFLRTHRLKLVFESASFADILPFPVEKINGRLRWENHRLYLEEMHAFARGMEASLTGHWFNELPAAASSFHLQLGGKNTPEKFDLRAQVAQNKLQGNFAFSQDTPLHFQAKVNRQAEKWTFQDLRFENGYEGEAGVSLQAAPSWLDLRKQERHLQIRSQIKKSALDFQFSLDHMNLYGMDLVTRGKMILKPAVKIGLRDWEYQGFFGTDYFVLDTLPFSDFKGSFLAGPQGIKDLSGSWGDVFEMSGKILRRGRRPEMKILVEIRGFDLAHAHELSTKPLPKLRGLLEGRVKIEGPLGSQARPKGGPLGQSEVSGDLSVKDGFIEKVEYDRAIIRFRGFPPVLPLHDSKILMGRTTLLLKGAVDLSCENVFQDVHIETADALVVWKGWEMNTSHEKGDFEFNRPLSRLPLLRLKIGQGDASPDAATENRQEDRYVAAGPKFKF